MCGQASTHMFSGLHWTSAEAFPVAGSTLLAKIFPTVKVISVSALSGPANSLCLTSRSLLACLRPAMMPTWKKSKFLAEKRDSLRFSFTPARFSCLLDSEAAIMAPTTLFLGHPNLPPNCSSLAQCHQGLF